MKNTTVAALAVAALVAGLALGTVGLASAKIPQAVRSAPARNGAEAKPWKGAAKAGMRMGGIMGADLVRVTAKLTGETTASVKAQLAAGKSFAEIGKAKNVTSTQIVELAMNAPKAAVASLVSDGLMTQAEADTALKAIEAKLTAAVEGGFKGVRPYGGKGGWGRRTMRDRAQGATQTAY